MPSRRSRPGRRLGVRFGSRTKVYLIPSISDYSDKEFTAMWMVDEDRAAAQAGILGDIKAMRTAGAGGAGATTDGEGHCSRGLEHMRSAAHMEQRKINKESVMNAVLDAQDAQFEANVINEEDLLEASSRNSRWARENAESMAASDAACVRRHVRPEVDAFMRAFTDRSGSAVSRAGDHLSVLQTALQVSDSEDSAESAGGKKQGSTTPPKKGRRLLSTSLQRSAHSSPNNTTLTHPSVKTPRSAVDALLNQMSSRVGAEAKVGAAAAGTRMDLPAPTFGDIAALNLRQGSS